MSKYSSKRRQPDCSVPECQNLATKLKMIHQKPWWLCPACADELLGSKL